MKNKNQVKKKLKLKKEIIAKIDLKKIVGGEMLLSPLQKPTKDTLCL